MLENNRVKLTNQANEFIDTFLTPKLGTPYVSLPSDYGMDYEEVEFTAKDGITLSGWLIKGKEDKVIIQAHPVTANRSGSDGSLGGPRLDFIKTAKAFVESGYSVLAFDARNHGYSQTGHQPFILGTIDDAPDFVAAVDYLSKHKIYKSAKVGIHSVCFGSNATILAFSLQDGLRSRPNLKAISLTQPASWGMLLRNNPDVSSIFVDEINTQLMKRGAKSLDFLPFGYAPNINVPTQVVQNSNDPLFSRDVIEQFYVSLNIQNDDKKLVWIDGDADRSHLYLYETERPSILVKWFDEYM